MRNWFGLDRLLRWLRHAARYEGILNDAQIAELVQRYGMIEPFVPRKIKAPEAYYSYGLEPFGYTFRLHERVHISGMHDLPGAESHLRAEPRFTECVIGDFILLPPHSIALCRSVEYFRLPDFVTGFLVGKSSYTRQGVVYMMSVVDAGYEGTISFAVANLSPMNVELRAREGIGQIIFVAGRRANNPYIGYYSGSVDVVSPALNPRK
ncbi:MAG: hypothetical protein QXT00_02150 [Ignisphaera sp.]